MCFSVCRVHQISPARDFAAGSERGCVAPVYNLSGRGCVVVVFTSLCACVCWWYAHDRMDGRGREGPEGGRGST